MNGACCVICILDKYHMKKCFCLIYIKTLDFLCTKLIYATTEQDPESTITQTHTHTQRELYVCNLYSVLRSNDGRFTTGQNTSEREMYLLRFFLEISPTSDFVSKDIFLSKLICNCTCVIDIHIYIVTII